MGETQAFHRDYLTGLFLRDAFYFILEESIINKKDELFSVVLFDIDGFKRYNDRYGHLCGDEIIKYVAQTVRLFFKEELCFRLGGDEFIIIVPEKSYEETLALLSKLREYFVLSPFLLEGKSYAPFKITLSCGVAVYPQDAGGLEGLFRKADAAMYFSKRHGRGLITFSGRIKYIKLRNFVFVAASLAIIAFFLTTFYQLYLRAPLANLINTLRNVKVIARQPENLDIIILKSGSVLKGKITRETDTGLELEMFLQTGEATIHLNKYEISSMVYGSKE